MLLGVDVNVILFSEDIWERAQVQAQQRWDQQEGKGKGKRPSKNSMACDIYTRTVQSHFDAEMGGRFGGTTWLSREKHY